MVKERSILLQSDICNVEALPSSTKNFAVRKNFATFGEVHSTKNSRVKQVSEITTPHYNTGSYQYQADVSSQKDNYSISEMALGASQPIKSHVLSNTRRKQNQDINFARPVQAKNHSHMANRFFDNKESSRMSVHQSHHQEDFPASQITSQSHTQQKKTLSQRQKMHQQPQVPQPEKRPYMNNGFKQKASQSQGKKGLVLADASQNSTMSQLPDHLLKQPNTTLILNIQNNYNNGQHKVDSLKRAEKLREFQQQLSQANQTPSYLSKQQQNLLAHRSHQRFSTSLN